MVVANASKTRMKSHLEVLRIKEGLKEIDVINYCKDNNVSDSMCKRLYKELVRLGKIS